MTINKPIFWHRDWNEIVAFFVGWRIALAIMGQFAYYNLPTNANMTPVITSFLGIWSRYDATWYIAIAQKGYGELYTAAFFPLWPAIIAGAQKILFLRAEAVAIALATIFCFFAVILLYRLARLDFDEPTAKYSALFFIISPMAFFFAIGYSEALFVTLVLLAFYLAKLKRWWWLIPVGIGIGLTRHVGILIVLPLTLLYLMQINFNWRKIRPDILSVLSIAIGFIIFMIYLKYRFNDPLAFIHAENLWGRHLASVDFARELWRDLKNMVHFSAESWQAGLRLISYLIPLFAIAIMIKIKRYEYALYVLCGAATPLLTGSSLSYVRIIAVLFPIYFAFAIWAKNIWFRYATMPIFIMMQALFICQFVNGFWVA